jgi:hypothetical protein
MSSVQMRIEFAIARLAEPEESALNYAKISVMASALTISRGWLRWL